MTNSTYWSILCRKCCLGEQLALPDFYSGLKQNSTSLNVQSWGGTFQLRLFSLYKVRRTTAWFNSDGSLPKHSAREGGQKIHQGIDKREKTLELLAIKSWNLLCNWSSSEVPAHEVMIAVFSPLWRAWCGGTLNLWSTFNFLWSGRNRFEHFKMNTILQIQ